MGQCLSIPTAQLLQLRSMALAHRFKAKHTLRGQQSLIRFTCRVRSITSASRSRVNRRSSSSAGVGGRTIEQTRRPPRARSISVSSSFSTSIRSVFACRLRLFTAIEAASTTCVSSGLILS
jgi:hypothetical protein